MFEGQKPLKLLGAKAGAGLTGASVQYKWVKWSYPNDNTVVLCSAATDKPCGVLQAPVVATGDAADVVAIGETLIQADLALAVGYGIGTAVDGQAAHYEASITGGAQNIYYVAGMVVNVAGAITAGNLITAVINCVNPPLGTLGV
jgi:hypothetical protein